MIDDKDKKVISELGDAIQNVADVKRAFAARAFQPVDRSLEAPRDVFMAACRAIGAGFVSQQFKFLKSDPLLIRKRGDWVDRIAFSSSKYNVRGEQVDFTVSILVCNNLLKKQRGNGQSPFPFNVEWGTVAGGDLGKLTEDDSFIHWNLANPENRDTVVADIVDHISRIGLPFIDKFRSFDVMTELWLASELPAFEIRSMIEIQMCYDQPQTAALCIERWLETNSDQIPSILSAMEQFRRKGVPASPSGWDETIAAAVLHYQLQVAGLST